MGRLFHRFVGRVAGLPASAFDTLRAVETVDGHATVRALEGRIDALAEPLTERLHEAIDGLDDRALRRALLQLKRDVHNRRPPRAGRVAELDGQVTPELWRALRDYHELHDQRRDLARALPETFDRELAEIRRRFQDLTGDEGFRRGLLLGSRTLAAELPRYRRADPERAGSKIRQIERSLMRYVSRAALKATPFSTLCTLLPGTFDATSGPPFTTDPGRQRSVARLNKGLYAAILAHLVRRPTVRRALDVELNPTLDTTGDGRWRFLFARGGHEVFQRLARNPVLDVVRRTLDGGPRRLGVLADELVAHPEIDADSDDATAYLVRLLEIGFLRFRIGIREQEVDWDRPLVEILRAIDDEHAAVIGDLLVRLRATVDAWPSASADRRRDLLDDGLAALKAVESDLDVHLLAPGKPILYEDAGGEAAMRLEPGDLGEILVDYVERVSRIAWPRAEQATMRAFFDRHYGPEHDPVPLLDFYEDYYREHFKQHLEREQRPRVGDADPASEPDDDTETETGAADYDHGNPFGLDVVAAIEDGHRRLGEHLRDRWHAAGDAEEIRLEPEDLDAVLGDVPPDGGGCRSASLFVQWLPATDDAPSALIANGTLVGFGKYFSRFLSVLPDDVRRDLVENNRRLTERDLAEICGDGAHNANLHPPLLPREISYPTGESGHADEQIPSARIRVGRNPDDPHRLRLEHPDGRGIVPVDLGFLNPRLRPALYRLLARFTPAANFSLSPPDVPAGGEGAVGDAPTAASYRPRITYRGRLVLARRQWRIAIDSFPARGKKESEADYFLRVRLWREAMGLPEEVFLRILPLPSASEAQPTEPTRTRDHLYKPQYLDFRNPLLVDLFSRSAEHLVNARFLFEERLPRDEHLLTHDDTRWVSELVVQVDVPDAVPDTEAIDG